MLPTPIIPPLRGLVLLLLLATVPAGLSGCASAAKRQRQAQAVEHAERAQLLMEQGLTDQALHEFALAIEDNPELIDAHMGIGEIHRERGDYNQAKQAYTQATVADPTSFQARYYLALMNQMLGELGDAVQNYLHALTLNPSSFEANHNLAGAYLQLNRPGQALPYARKATELNPDSQGAWSNLAATYSLLRRYEQAVDAYRQAVELGELSEPILLGLADAHIRLGNHDRAVNVLRQLIREKPSSTAYERLGYAQFKMRRFDDALASFRAALSRNSRDIAALNGMGVSLMTLYIQGDRADRDLWEQALSAWRRSTEIDPNQPRIVDLISRYQRI